ncbi:hypothetical protein P3X46_010556 [Hevea brasiliensis]|uniref:Reverse transcriptase zinc-binding domain-containing protein n=1 Tax=Hevea brasiliensis TaxID=3981 RepID=A0ABQ9MGT7_HEVBR|nr:hypothetical protein P3X46_010556 [Hevea brasiliensis]
MAVASISKNLLNKLVIAFVDATGSWSVNLFKTYLPKKIFLKIVSIPSASVTQPEDGVFWVAQEHILTNVERVRRHLSTSSSCEVCLIGEEDVLHVLRDCPFTRQLWELD